MRSSPLFDVEQFRDRPTRLAIVRRAEEPILVLGSTQAAEVVDAPRAARRGMQVVRRRGGGGAVLLQPGDHLWVDAWVPRSDPLWVADVSAAASPIGAWWSSALAGVGVDDLEVQEGRAVPGELGELVCFAGQGPGEVIHRGRKVTGLSQWRSREGALFSACAYTRWDPVSLADVFRLGEEAREQLRRDLAWVAVGLGDLTPGGGDLDALGEVLLSTFPTWGTSGQPFGV